MEPKAPGLTQLYRGRMDSWVMLDRKGLCFAPTEVPVVLWLLSEFSLQFSTLFSGPQAHPPRLGTMASADPSPPSWISTAPSSLSVMSTPPLWAPSPSPATPLPPRATQPSWSPISASSSGITVPLLSQLAPAPSSALRPCPLSCHPSPTTRGTSCS